MSGYLYHLAPVTVECAALYQSLMQPFLNQLPSKSKESASTSQGTILHFPSKAWILYYLANEGITHQTL